MDPGKWDLTRWYRVTGYPQVWCQSLGIRLPKVVFPQVDGWSTGPPVFWASQLGIRAYVYEYLGLSWHESRTCIYFAPIPAWYQSIGMRLPRV